MSHILENYVYSTHTYQFLLANKTAKFISWVYILPFLEDDTTVHTFWRLLLLKVRKMNVLYSDNLDPEYLLFKHDPQ